jgi:hypothetical protein
MKTSSNLPLRFWRKQTILEKTQERKRPLTVCISAICEHNMIIGASDRMLTAGDIEFEPSPTSSGSDLSLKVSPLNDRRSMVMMLAGETTLQTEILTAMIHFIPEWEKKNGKNYQVKDAVSLYIDCYNQIKARLATSAILAPLGLDQNTFVSRQKEMLDSFAETVGRLLVDFQMPAVETIITGIDDTTAHIYKLFGNNAVCCDLIGFAAIGSGANHAESQFMLNGYSRIVPQEEALWLTYMAKRKSEVAPGVGKITDLFCITSKNSTFKPLNELAEKLNFGKIYDDFNIKQTSEFQEAKGRVKPLLEAMKTPPHKD